MQNSNEFVRSRGVILFAFNTKSVDYVTIADRCAQLIDKNLQLPITLVTDSDSSPMFEYDHIIRVSSKGGNFRLNSKFETQEWKNFDRYLAYELSPYTSTILMDTDYLVLDDSLLKILDTTVDYRLMHHNSTDAGPSIEVMGETSLPFVWATVVTFNKTERARLFFKLIGRIQRNYGYYQMLYNIREGNYRNDYAFAIANIILNGYDTNESQGIPWTMYSVDRKVQKMTLSDNFIKIHYHNRATVIPYGNVHVLDKEYLLSDDFKQLLENIIESV